MQKKQERSKKIKKRGLYLKINLTRKLKVPFTVVGSNFDSILLDNLKEQLEGKCSTEGYIKPNSINIITYSSGIIRENNVIFEVAFECLACRPVEGMRISCIIRNITKAGIRAEINKKISPLIIFIARDHQHQSKYFSSRKEGDNIVIRVIGQRFELNDKYISIIATLVEPKTFSRK